jgi:hypothetical protein
VEIPNAAASVANAEFTSSTALDERQWRTIRLGAWTVAVALAIAFVIVPFGRTWVARERAIDAAEARLGQLAGVVNGRARTDSAATAIEAQLAAQPTRVLHARSRALAASALQSLVQELADVSNVTVTRLDVANADTGAGDLPITLSANGDIYGLAALLQQFRHARQVLVVDKLSVQVNSALRGAPDVLQSTITLHAPVVIE